MNNDLLKFKSELETELHSNILHYWRTKAVDTKNGGFIGHIDNTDTCIFDATKGVVLNARILWTFASAYRIFKKPNDLELARRAFDYITNHFIDKKYGGVYWELDYTGKPLNPRKQIYGLSFVMYGMVEFNRACGDNKALEIAIDLFNLIEKHSFDKENNGYIEALSQEWNKLDDLRLSEKDDNESKTMNTHLHVLEAYTNLYRVWKNEVLGTALKNLIRLFIDKFINVDFNLNLFFDDYWNLKSDLISYGHDIECSWLLHEAAEVSGDYELIRTTAELAVKMAKQAFKGIDDDGGMIYETFPSKKHTDADKHWWPQAEAVVGFYNAYQLSGKPEFLEKAMGSWNFIKDYIVDKENGEWFWSVNKEGIPDKNHEKAGFWKCPYHNGRACMEMIERLNINQ
jgi:mannobiose 2-epimerase